MKRKRKRRRPEEIIRILHHARAALATGKSVEEICREVGIDSSTFYRWQQQFGSMGPNEAKRLRALEQENKRLKKIIADLELDKAILKETLEGNY